MASYRDVVNDDYGRPIPGVLVYVFNKDGSLASLIGGQANPITTDTLGGFSFNAADAVYSLEFRFAGVTRRLDNVIVGKPPEYQGDTGPTGPANSTYTSLTALKSAPQSNRSYILADGTNSPVTYAYVSDSFTQLVARDPSVLDRDIVKLNGVDLSIGALVRVGAKSASYAIPAPNAAYQNQEDKFYQTVNLLDFVHEPDKDKLKAGAYVDLGYAVKAACNEVTGRNSAPGVTVGGKALVLPPYRISTSEPFDLRSRNQFGVTDDGDTRRATIIGPGRACCIVYYQGDPAIPALMVEGNNDNDGRNVKLELRGFSLYRQNGGEGQGVGIDAMNCSDIVFDGFELAKFNIGFLAEGVLGVTAIDTHILGCNSGIAASRGMGFTYPNVWKFIGGRQSGHSTITAEYRGACCVVYDGVKMEANGAGEVGAEPNKANQFVLRMLDAPSEGSTWLHLTGGCYFENNNVETEVLLQSSNEQWATAKIDSCSFARISNIRNPNRHIDFNMTGTGKLGAKIDSVLFDSLNNRTPNPSLKSYRNQTANTIVTVSNVLHKLSVEGPDTGGFPLVGQTYPVVDVLVNADGSYEPNPLITNNVREVVKSGVGKYTVYFRTAPANPTTVHYMLKQDDNTGTATVTFKSGGGVDVELRVSPEGALVDRAFVLQGNGSFT